MSSTRRNCTRVAMPAARCQSTKTNSLGVGDSGAGFVTGPGIGGLVVGRRANFRILHDDASAGVPAQDGGVVAWGAELRSGFVVGHGGTQRVVRGGVTAVVDAGVAHA